MPGHTALTVMPAEPSSIAHVWVSRMIPDLAAQYAPSVGMPRLPACDDTLTIAPFTPAATMRAAVALVTRNMLRRLSEMILSN